MENNVKRTKMMIKKRGKTVKIEMKTLENKKNNNPCLSS